MTVEYRVFARRTLAGVYRIDEAGRATLIEETLVVAEAAGGNVNGSEAFRLEASVMIASA